MTQTRRQRAAAPARTRAGVPPDSGRPTALVLGNYRAGLTTVRELSALGYRVILGSEPAAFSVDYSRHVDRVWQTPPPIPGSRRYLDALLELLQREPDLKVIVPINEPTVNAIASIEDDLKPVVDVASPSAAVVSICHDKHQWSRFLQEAGIGCPPFRVANDLAAVDDAVATVGTPAVIRPIESGARIGLDKVLFVSEEAGRTDVLPEWPEGVARLLVQRRFVGERYNVYFAARAGVVLREQHSACLRSARADGAGQTIEGITIRPVPALSADVEAAVRALGYTGVGNAQFLYDPATETTCFLEINPRFGASYALVEAVGMGLTRLAVELADDDPSTPAATTYEVDEGTRVIGMYTDLAGLAHAVRAREVGPLGAARWLGAAVVGLVRADVHVTWSWRDPVPALTIPFYRVISWVGRRRAWLARRLG